MTFEAKRRGKLRGVAHIDPGQGAIVILGLRWWLAPAAITPESSALHAAGASIG
jgi:hypothetical protein